MIYEKIINLKNIVISADGDRMVYSVPNKVADNLEQYCLEFCTKWIRTNPNYIINDVACYNETDFIEYLNKWIFPNEQSKFVENLGQIEFDATLPEKYRDCPVFNF